MREQNVKYDIEDLHIIAGRTRGLWVNNGLMDTNDYGKLKEAVEEMKRIINRIDTDTYALGLEWSK